MHEALASAGVPRCEYQSRGQGFKDGGEDVRLFRRAALSGRLKPAPSLLLSAVVAEATTISDPAGNAKLAKNTEGGRRKRARDDTAAAAILAVSLAERMTRGKPVPDPAPACSFYIVGDDGEEEA